MKIPNLDDEIIPVSKSLINASSFEISKKEKVNPIYFRNLLNVIQIINFVWIASKKSVGLFHNTLINIGLMLSYFFRNEKDDKDGVDFALLTPIPNIVYDFIAKNGKNSFKSPNNFNFDEDISDTQIDYVYKESSISQILSTFEPEKITICPNIIYYLEHNSAIKLFNEKIFDSPVYYTSLICDEKKFNGYNKIDMSFFLSETTKIKENHIFNIVKKKNEDLIYKFYTSNASKEIMFEKGAGVFLELKTSAKNSKIDDILQ